MRLGRKRNRGKTSGKTNKLSRRELETLKLKIEQ
jgi:hypothetical protein